MEEKVKINTEDVKNEKAVCCCCHNDPCTCKTKEAEKKAYCMPERYFELTPAADIADDEQGAELILEVPGANASTVSVEVREHILSITAGSILCRRDLPVVYKREFRLSDAVDITGIKAKTADGLLNIFLPKSERAKIHRIQVQG